MHTATRGPGRAGVVAALGVVAVALAVAVPATLVGASGPASGPPSLSSPVAAAPDVGGQPPLRGALSAADGQFLVDANGRVVFLHGVNAVYKAPPYVLFPDAGKPWSFTAADASLMARLGFDVVRLGITWKGLEPGTAPANDPAICTPGTPHDPGQYNASVLRAYLAKVARTVTLLGRFHIYTLLDMHQDVYNEMFDGEGAPDWAVCTNGVRATDPPGRWSLEYSTTAADIAYGHFWNNDVVGDLQGEFDRVWAAVAGYFRSSPWVVGYDPFNEPFSTGLVRQGSTLVDAALECFYTGRGPGGGPAQGDGGVTCPAGDPSAGVVPTIRRADPTHLIFFEPDIYGRAGTANVLGTVGYRNLVYNVHVYCPQRSGVTGDPTNLEACADHAAAALANRQADRVALASAAQPAGPAWFMSEFGATSSLPLVAEVTRQADDQLVGWTYWSWKYYSDPTGSSDEALVLPDGALQPTAAALSQTYAQAVAGVPLSMSFDPATAAFDLSYRANLSITAPTVVFVPTALHYPAGYCATAQGARVTSASNSELLTVENTRASRVVDVHVRAGPCP